MPAVNPAGDAMSIVMCQFSPDPATDWAGVERNIERIFEYVDRACNGFPGVDLIVVPEYSTHGFGFSGKTSTPESNLRLTLASPPSTSALGLERRPRLLVFIRRPRGNQN